MPAKENQESKKVAETVGEMLRLFGNTVSEVLDDPTLKQKAKEFAASLVDSAARVADNKIKAHEARAKLRDVGKAAQTLGKSLETHFEN
jgi:[ribosomal protein S5]-alanine N-acetyltransferase